MTVVRLTALVFGLLGGLAPAVLGGTAFAQTNIDQGKSPAEIFTADCATCHKTIRGLASGQNSLALSSFLREHYTASREQASALAAYVLGAGGGQAAPKQKPETATREEPKPSEPKGAARSGRAGAKPAETASKPAQEEEKPAERPASASLERREAKPEERPASAAPERREVKPAAGPRDNATASREKKEPVEAPPAQNTAPVLAAPAPAAPASTEAHGTAAPAATAELPGVGPITNAAAPAEPPSEAVPRDHIPD